MVNPSDLSRRRWVRTALAGLAVLGLAAGGYVLAVVPPTADTWYPKCTLHSVTGLHCPGCGTTRAYHALLNGRVAQACAYNAIAVALLPALGWWLFQLAFRPLHTRTTRASRWTGFLAWFIFVSVFAFGIIRNLPWYPFTLLAPHEL
jgi:hypothetical protein